ncbi:ABC-type transport auxiliary lipoprotein family protein [Novosphingobium lentum]|uniref:ABC-type transport auxiliary lipoprotein family protein n=1 Tax=Novosphingobium lentum TaxID=145287 RepID=UPI001FDEFD29|nr:ABC-type transport auxiliary lipoprotein family protein [Novosphingobium lentum]
MRKLLLAAPLLALSLGGCVSFGAKPPPTLFNLTPDHPAAAGATSSGTYANAIVVLEPTADQRLDVLRVPVQVDPSSVAYLQKALWVARPARLFQHLIAETLRGRGTRLVVEADPGMGGLRLSGHLIDMGYDKATSSAVVRFDAVKEGPGGRVETKRFESTVSGIEAKPEVVGPALNQAANTVAGQVADWVG